MVARGLQDLFGVFRTSPFLGVFHKLDIQWWRSLTLEQRTESTYDKYQQTLLHYLLSKYDMEENEKETMTQARKPALPWADMGIDSPRTTTRLQLKVIGKSKTEKVSNVGSPFKVGLGLVEVQFGCLICRFQFFSPALGHNLQSPASAVHLTKHRNETNDG